MRHRAGDGTQSETKHALDVLVELSDLADSSGGHPR